MNVKSTREAVAEVVAGGRLKSLPVMHQCLYGICLLSSGKLFLVGLLPLHNRYGKELPAKIRIDVQHLYRELLRLLLRGMGSMPLLPEELGGTKERPRRLFPADDRAPLIVGLRKIPVGLDYGFIKLAKQSLRGGAHAKPLLELIRPAVCHPGDLGSEALHMILLLVQKGFRDQHRKITVLDPDLLEPSVKLSLDVLPDGITRGKIIHEPLDGRIAHEPRFFYNIGVPLREIHIP